MSSAPTAADIAKDATWLAQALDPATGAVRLIAMNREGYRAASFLDDRLLASPVDAHVVAWTEIEAAMAGQPRSDGIISKATKARIGTSSATNVA